MIQPLQGQGLKALALRGSLWTLAGYGASQVLRLGANIVLARLLFPEAFGLMALVNIFMQGLAMFTDVGIGPSIIQNKRGEDPTFLDTAWTIQVIRGVSLWIVSCLIAWPIAHFYGEPALIQLIPAVGITAAISGFQTTSIFTANRRLGLGRLTALQLFSQAVSIVVMLAWAYVSPSPWALVAGGIVASSTTTVFGFCVMPSHRHRMRWDPSASRELLHFGKWIFVSSMLAFCSTQADRLILGKLVTPSLLGVFSVGLVIPLAIQSVILQLSGRITFPLFARLQHLPVEKLRQRVRSPRIACLSLTLLAVLPLSWFGGDLIEVMYDDRYAIAGEILPVVAIGIWPQALSMTIGPVLRARGYPQWAAYGSLARLMWIVAATPVAHGLFGVIGVGGVVALRDVPYYVVISAGLCRHRLHLLRQDAIMTLVFVLLVAVGFMLKG